MEAVRKLTDEEIVTMIEIYSNELAERDFKRARRLLAQLAIELVDKRLEKMGL